MGVSTFTVLVYCNYVFNLFSQHPVVSTEEVNISTSARNSLVPNSNSSSRTVPFGRESAGPSVLAVSDYNIMFPSVTILISSL